ncbi:MAG: hypothetical protein JOZ69_18785 [Myxococcales bacterium]|nr:hypothetical protein [Myxococcales bacterium]
MASSRGDPAMDAELPRPQSSSPPLAFALVRRGWAWVGATDVRLVAAVGVVLFALSAWPLLLVALPPLQDLPNHLATLTVLEHPAEYPEFVSNGFLKTNSALYVWLILAGRVFGPLGAARGFVALVLALGAFALPRFVLAFGGRRRMLVSCVFVGPMVHDWFVSAGMLDFALALPLSLLLLVGLAEQRARAGFARGAGIALLALFVWYAHVFPLFVVGFLVLLDVIARRSDAERLRAAGALGGPLLPAALLAAGSLAVQLTEPAGAMSGYLQIRRFLPAWELLYNLWAEWTYGFTSLERATLVPCVVLAALALRRRGARVPLLGPTAMLGLAMLYVLLPHATGNWFHVNSRVIPFLWAGALVRLPERLPRAVAAILAACTLVSSAGMGVDYVRLDRERAEFTAGMDAVPAGSRLLPLVFRSKVTSDNTRNLLHAWGFYVLEKHTSAPLLFAHSRSFAVTYRIPPSPRWNHLVLEAFAPAMISPEAMCEPMRSRGLQILDCDEAWRDAWDAFWGEARPEFDHVLLWSAPDDVVARLPPFYRVVFRRGELTVLERT